MISKAIEVSITKTSLIKIRLFQREYEWADDGSIIRNDVSTMLYILFKRINPATRIGVSNLKDEIDKTTLAKFGNNLKDLLDDMSSNYTTIIDKGESHADYVFHNFRALLTGKN